MPSILDYLKYANIQMAAEAFLTTASGETLGQSGTDPEVSPHFHVTRPKGVRDISIFVSHGDLVHLSESESSTKGVRVISLFVLHRCILCFQKVK